MKTIQACKNTLDATLCSLPNPRLVLIESANGKTTNLTAADLENPANWVEIAEVATSNRKDLTGKLNAIAAAVAGDGGSGAKITQPASQVAHTWAANAAVVAIAVVSGTGALSSATVGRVVDIADKTYVAGETATWDPNTWTSNED